MLRSALQNANHLSQEQGLDVDVDNLYVKSAVANDGPRMKRIRPAPMGRAYRYQRRLVAYCDCGGGAGARRWSGAAGGRGVGGGAGEGSREENAGQEGRRAKKASGTEEGDRAQAGQEGRGEEARRKKK